MQRSTLLAVLVLGSCGPRVNDDHDAGAGAGEAASNGSVDLGCGDEPSCSDPMACGEERLECRGANGPGECVGGLCQPEFSGCFVLERPEAQTCDAICSSADAACVAQGCEGLTAMAWPIFPTELCEERDAALRRDLAIGCEEEVVVPVDGDVLFRCCCDFNNHG